MGKGRSERISGLLPDAGRWVLVAGIHSRSFAVGPPAARVLDNAWRGTDGGGTVAVGESSVGSLGRDAPRSTPRPPGSVFASAVRLQAGMAARPRTQTAAMLRRLRRNMMGVQRVRHPLPGVRGQSPISANISGRQPEGWTPTEGLFIGGSEARTVGVHASACLILALMGQSPNAIKFLPTTGWSKSRRVEPPPTFKSQNNVGGASAPRPPRQKLNGIGQSPWCSA